MPRANRKAGSTQSTTRGQKSCPHCGSLVPARWFQRHLTEKHGPAAQGKSAEASNVTEPMKQLTESKLECPHCGKKFAALSGLASHLHFVHPGKKAGAQPKTAQSAAVAAKPDAGAGAHKCSHCGQSFTAPHRLAQHIQFRHAGKSPAKAAPAASTTASVSAIPAAPATTVQGHLASALQELTQRQRDIELQLARIDSLNAEKEAIGRQIDALNTALEAFKG